MKSQDFRYGEKAEDHTVYFLSRSKLSMIEKK